MLRMADNEERFELALRADFGFGGPPPELHPGPHRIYPHEDPEALAIEIAEVADYRRGAPDVLL